MDNRHQKLGEALQQEAELDTKMIEKLNEIIGLYQEARHAIARRRKVSRMIVTAIRHGDEKRLKGLVEDWQEATRKVARYRL